MDEPMIVVPKWMNKPRNNQRVVATSRGWEVEKTGELLVNVKDLDKRIKAYQEELEKVVELAKEASRQKPGRKPGQIYGTQVEGSDEVTDQEAEGAKTAEVPAQEVDAAKPAAVIEIAKPVTKAKEPAPKGNKKGGR